MTPLLPFFQWCQDTALGTGIRNSTYWFPWIEVFHLLGLAVLGGTILAVDMRVLGVILRREPVARLAKSLQPLMVAGLIVMLVSGVLLFLSEAMKCYENVPFRLKMIFLFAAILFTFTVRRRVTASLVEETAPIRTWMKFMSVISLLLWSGVGVMGRGIGFY